MYINFMNQENKNIYISFWLMLITFLVSLTIIVGGLTRLTDSGLSITRWDLISGILPPFTLDQWNNSFNLYKQIPEYKLINSSMTLDEFKFIYWWEYVHRILGRLIGLLYIIPLLYFTYKGLIKKNSLKSLYFILLLIAAQGTIGWFMVKSGLVERTDVSHYLLSLHLTLAFIIFILLLWNYLKYKNNQNYIFLENPPIYLLIFFVLCLIVQISIGAFVSGLDAGQIYTSWPLMNEAYFPDDSNIKDLFSINAFETPSIVQFIHRNIAYLIVILFSFITWIIFNRKNLKQLRSITTLVFIFLIFQIILGIFTVTSGAKIILASLHQIGSIFLVTASTILVFKSTKIN